MKKSLLTVLGAIFIFLAAFSAVSCGGGGGGGGAIAAAGGNNKGKHFGSGTESGSKIQLTSNQLFSGETASMMATTSYDFIRLKVSVNGIETIHQIQKGQNIELNIGTTIGDKLQMYAEICDASGTVLRTATSDPITVGLGTNNVVMYIIYKAKLHHADGTTTEYPFTSRGATLPVDGTSYKISGYVFNAWASGTSDGSYDGTNASGIFTNSIAPNTRRDIDLYAYWVPAPQAGGITKYKVKYHHYNGTTTQAEYEATHAAVDLSTISTPAHPTAGYAKVGWGTSADNGTTIDTPYIKKLSFNAAGITATGIDNSTFMLTNPVDLWVVWDGFTPERIAAIMADTKVFEVVTTEQFNQLLEYANGNNTYKTFSGATIKLMTDVSATYTSGGLKNFAGTIEGNKHTVTLSNGYALVTGTLAASGEIKNLTTTGTVSSKAAVAEQSRGNITYVTNKATVSTSAARGGGIVGKFYTGTISCCVNEGNVTTASYAGGIVGEYGAGTIEKCYNKGTITCTSSSGDSGGIAGCSSTSSGSDPISFNVRIKNCYNVGTIKKVASEGGGISGYLNSGASIQCCHSYTTGNVSRMTYGSVSNSYSLGTSGWTVSNFSDLSNFNGFDSSIWKMGDSYPVLRGVGEGN